MWAPFLEGGKLALVSGPRSHTRGFHQELAHQALHRTEGSVLWCDGDHGFNPYDFAELNLERGFDAEWGADRILVKRCMTPFQWDTVLTRHLEERLMATRVSLVVVGPYEDLFSTDELQDWEREDYIEFSLAHLKSVSRRYHVPVVIAVCMANWCKMYPLLAWKAYEAADSRWAVEPMPSGWRAVEVGRELMASSIPVRQVTLHDFDWSEAPEGWHPWVSAATNLGPTRPAGKGRVA